MQTIHENLPDETRQLKNDYRNRIEVLTRRICLLTGTDRVLMTMYLVNGNTFYQMAKLSGLSQSAISRRIHKVTNKLIDGEYITCLKNRNKFNDAELKIAKDYFLAGKSIRCIAHKYKMTYYKAQKTIKKLRNCIEAIQS